MAAETAETAGMPYAAGGTPEEARETEGATLEAEGAWVGPEWAGATRDAR